MTRAILLVDHGSRRPEANALLEAVAERLRPRAQGSPVFVAHMELAAPSIAEGIEACTEAGASEIVVHPYLLTPGRHSRQDIPAQAEAAARNHPGVRVEVSEPLGVGAHDKLIDVVLERIEEAERRS